MVKMRLADLEGQNGGRAELDGQNNDRADAHGEKSLVVFDGQNDNLDDENVFRWSEPTVISTMAASDDVSKSKFKLVPWCKKAKKSKMDPCGLIGRSISTEVLVCEILS